MLYITELTEQKSSGAIGYYHVTISWHVGEPLPQLTAKVITFQADGDELQVILEALREKAQKVKKDGENNNQNETKL